MVTIPGSPRSPVKLLHTSDWHLGQTLYDQERGYEMQCFLDWLLGELEREAPELLLIAGDVFDSVNPPVAAQRQLYAFLASAVRALPRLQIVMIAGNHDSGARIEMPAPLLQGFGVSVIGRVTRDADGALDVERLRIPIRGPEDAVLGHVLALPFLRPAEITAPEESHADAVARTHAELIGAAVAARRPGEALVAISHAHMQGGEVSPASERRIVVGNAEAVPSALFPPEIAYVALGHLHLAQWVGGEERIRYCGSPIPMSMSERDYQHQVLLVEIEGEALQAIRCLPVPRAVPMRQIRGTLSEVLAALATIDAPPQPRERQPWLEVRVLLERPLLDLAQQIDAALAGKSVRLLGPSAEYPQAADAHGPALSELEQIDPALLFARAWERKFQQPADDAVMRDFALLLAEAEAEDPRRANP
jgi:exonuclease SbcD